MIRPFSHESRFNWVLNMHDSDRRRRFGTVAFGQLDPSGAIHFTLYAKSGCQPWTRRSEFRNSFKKSPLKHSSNLEVDPDEQKCRTPSTSGSLIQCSHWNMIYISGSSKYRAPPFQWFKNVMVWIVEVLIALFSKKWSNYAPFPDKPTWKFQRFQCTDRGAKKVDPSWTSWAFTHSRAPAVRDWNRVLPSRSPQLGRNMEKLTEHYHSSQHFSTI